MTGTNPGRHGIYGFVNYNPDSYSQIDEKLVTAIPLRGRTLFDILSRHDLRVAAISVPITYPAWEINGFMVSGEPCPDTRTGLASPAEFAKSLNRRYAFQSSFWSKSNDEIIAGLYEMDDLRTELAIRLLEEEEIDALFLVLGSTDRVQHNFWRFYDPDFGARLGLPHEQKYEQVIPETYRRADRLIGRLIASLNDEALVFVISDHGGGSAATVHLNTNAWLHQAGYLGIHATKDSIAARLKGPVFFLRRALDNTLGDRLRKYLPDRLIRQGRALVRNIAQIDWDSTRAYRFPMYPPAEGIVINLRGRQEKGVVERRVYEPLREVIIEEMLGVRNPLTGEKVVAEAFRREELYEGPHIHNAPDIILILQDGYTGGSQISGALVTPVDPASLLKVNGEHRMHGILIANGSGIEPAGEIKDAHLVDMTPTILYGLGLPIPSEMDGKILTELFTEEHLRTAPRAAPAQLELQVAEADGFLTPEDERAMKEQLKRLGYL
jgi:predicted AlkP superfamily phosphohydrolase/phosphomutase